MADILNIQSPVEFDNSIINYEIHAHQPYTGPNFNHSDEIRIAIQYQDLAVLPSGSHLHVTGQLRKTDGTRPTNTKLIDMCIGHIIDDMRYELNAIEIDRNKNTGITTVLKGLASLYRDNSLINAGWFEEVGDEEGRFDVCIPLNQLFGFAEDYKKIIVNARHELIIRRSNTDLNAVKQTNIGTAENPKFENIKINISKIEWLMPYVTLSDEYKIRLLNHLQKGVPIPMSYRGWELHEWPRVPTATRNNWLIKTSNQLEKPRFMIIGFQTNRKNNGEKSASCFDHCKINNLRVYLNSQYYPYNNLNTDFTANQISLLYENYINFYNVYYNPPITHRKPMVNRTEFVTDTPIFVIDCSKQNESMKNAPVDVRVEFESAENIPENTAAYCLIIHDRIVEYNPITGDVKKIV